VISSFCRDVVDNCALLGSYAASSGNSFDVWLVPVGPIFKGKESNWWWHRQVVSKRQYEFPLHAGTIGSITIYNGTSYIIAMVSSFRGLFFFRSMVYFNNLCVCVCVGGGVP